MNDLTLESLARRVDALEKVIAANEAGRARRDWRDVVGISEDNEFTRLMLAEIEAAHQADRQAALSEEGQ